MWYIGIWVLPVQEICISIPGGTCEGEVNPCKHSCPGSRCLQMNSGGWRGLWWIHVPLIEVHCMYPVVFLRSGCNVGSRLVLWSCHSFHGLGVKLDRHCCKCTHGIYEVVGETDLLIWVQTISAWATVSRVMIESRSKSMPKEIVAIESHVNILDNQVARSLEAHISGWNKMIIYSTPRMYWHVCQSFD